MAEVLLIGGGGREHAIASALSKSPLVRSIIASPGNAGTSETANTRNCKLNVKNHSEVIKSCKDWGVSLVVIGPEEPLADGLTDSLEKCGINVFGPSKNAARIEASKAWAKEFMKRHNIPTADFETFSDLNDAQNFIDRCTWNGYAIKASGLSGGKGVSVVSDKTSAKRVLETFKINPSQKVREASETVVIEEKLTGYEISVLAFTDGTNIQMMLPAQDHKRRFGGDLGPNTGGMGVYCPCPFVSVEDMKTIENILQTTIDGMRDEGFPYKGVLYAGIMITADGPKVLEYNCRFGDPETQALMLLLDCDLYSVMKACACGSLKHTPVSFLQNTFAAAVAVVIENYPLDVAKGINLPINGIERVRKHNSASIIIGGACKDERSNTYLTSGGRVLNVCAVGTSLKETIGAALEGAKNISFQNAPQGYIADFRGDIGFQAIKRLEHRKQTNLSYRNAGVDIDEGSAFVEKIRALTISPCRRGVVNETGMFGAVFDTKLEGYKDPLLISGTDGVGTKLKIAVEYNNHKTVGQDLVAMSVNDILVHSAEPLFFLDYLSCSNLRSIPKSGIIEGIYNGCILANCALVGGETAEMPGMYKDNEYDLAGFAVGAVERENLLPRRDLMKAGNILIGVASSGVHSNGFSLIRKIMQGLNLSVNDPAPFHPAVTLGKELLKPTYIYTPLLQLLRQSFVLGAAHITGGGLEENLLRVIPESLGVKLEANWNIPSIFPWLSALGIPTDEMLRTFNLGIGLVLVIEANNEDFAMLCINDSFISKLKKDDKATYPHSKFKQEEKKETGCWVIGSLVENKGNRRFDISGIDESLSHNGALLLDTYPNCVQFSTRKRVAVLISGSGTNLQALLDHTMSGLSKAEIVLVISNVEGVKGLERATKANVPNVVISHKNLPRHQFEDKIQEFLINYNIDIICLAGFMRILTGDFVQKWNGKMLNVHPSILPSFKGANAQKQALEAGVCVSGCSIHFVVEEVDGGAIIVQEAVPVLPNDDVDALSERIRVAEHNAYPRALELVASGKVFLNNNGQIQKI